MTDQIKMPKGGEIALGALTALGLSLALTTQALAVEAMIVRNDSTKNHLVSCPNDKKPIVLRPTKADTCYRNNGEKLYITIDKTVYYFDPSVGNNLYIEPDGKVTRQ